MDKIFENVVDSEVGLSWGGFVQELFEKQVERVPNAIAVVFEEQKLTYRELNDRSNQLARYLMEVRGVKPESLVGFLFDRSIDIIVSMLGILKAGGAYVPLDVNYPLTRIRYMIENSRVSTILTETSYQAKYGLSTEQVLCLDDPETKKEISVYSTENLDRRVIGTAANNLVYVIYTSGTTGLPKGVMIEHGGLCNNILDKITRFALNHESILLQNLSFSFDAATEVIWSSLASGAQLVISSHEQSLPSTIQRYGVTHLTMTPSLLQVLDPTDLPTIKLICVAGEVCHSTLVEKWLPTVRFFNGYGPTEASICATMKECFPGEAITIGRAIPNVKVYILDENLLPVPENSPGELCIAGIGLARGYLGAEDFTKEKFVSARLAQQVGGAEVRIYRTGDLAKYVPNGEIEFLGRMDQQVKIRGFRIELGEIETALMSSDLVKDTSVIVRDFGNGDKRLVGYVVKQEPNDVTNYGIGVPAKEHESKFLDALLNHLSDRLPEYMIPGSYVFLDKLPLTPNGKIDKGALPEPEIVNSEDGYVAPRNRIESELCRVWQEVLKLERVGIHDNFFELGGDSIRVVSVITKLEKRKLFLSTDDFFNKKTLSEVALVVEVRDLEAENSAAQTAADSQGLLKIGNSESGFFTLTEGEIEMISSKVVGGMENVQDLYPLTHFQEGLLFHRMKNQKCDPYVLTTLYNLDNTAVLDSFLEALQQIISRHDVLRSTIFWEGLADPIQLVYKNATLKVRWLDLDEDQSVYSQMLERCRSKEQWIVFDGNILIGVEVAQDPRSSQVSVLMKSHHILGDHQCLEMIQNELVAIARGTFQSLPAAVPYRNFVDHLAKTNSNSIAEKYFHEVLGDIEDSTLPFGLSDNNGDGSQILDFKKVLSNEFSQTIRKIARAHSVSPAVLFHAAWAIVIAQCSGREDIVFGSVLFGRMNNSISTENMMGMFINTLPLRLKLHDASAVDFVAQVHTALTGLLRFDQTPLSVAQGQSKMPQGAPLFSSLVNYRHVGRNVATNVLYPGVEIVHSQSLSNFPLVLSVNAFDEGFEVEVQIHLSVEPKRVMEYLEVALNGLLQALLKNPQQIVTTLSVLPEEERKRLIFDWNDTNQTWDNEPVSIDQLIARRALETPSAIAVLSEQGSYSYHEIDTLATRVSQYLGSQGIGMGSLVGLFVDRSINIVSYIIGIYRSGAAYVPLDPVYPQSRLEYMINDSKIEMILTETRVWEQISWVSTHLVCIDEKVKSVPDVPPQEKIVPYPSSRIAYVMYTSGSTGKPKGVMVTHENLTNFFSSMSVLLNIKNSDVVLAVTTLAFDISGLELFLPLMCGAKVVIASRSDAADGSRLIQYLSDYKISIMQATPATWRLMLASDWPASKTELTILCGGEALSLDLAQALSERTDRLYNVYGPTETTIWSTLKKYDPSFSKITIGNPIHNTYIYILDSNRQLVPTGIAGDLYISGRGVSRGYLNRSDLTIERFFSDPFRENEAVYKTGDTARWTPDGEIEYLGRSDFQVKINGFRIELGEIEACLSRYSVIHEAIVIAREDELGKNSLVAYFTSEAPIDNETLYQYLSESLPSYMIPSAFVRLDKLPATANGKRDRKNLPAPELSNYATTDYQAPEGEIEILVAKVWSEILSIERVGRHDNFFKIGGDSLKAMLVIFRLNKLGIDISITDIFDRYTVAEIAKDVESLGITRIKDK